ncbi:MAG TPA: hypothetical protein VLT89_09285 [Usitatibacter sp.]|nr:hypothetical protein [Usitatibacter sp.]
MATRTPAARALRAFAFFAALFAGAALAQDNPLARRPTDPRSVLPGNWNGANLESRSNCAAPENNGAHGTYAAYVVSFDPLASMLGVDETAITGLHCTYLGAYGAGGAPTWAGTYSCTDGKQGSFRATGILATPNAMSLRLSIKLTGTETCDVDSILGGSRF